MGRILPRRLTRKHLAGVAAQFGGAANKLDEIRDLVRSRGTRQRDLQHVPHAVFG